ncbi:unnamed protein product [Urochloa humidicola]
MEIQKEKGIYELGSLPPFLLVFAGEVEVVDHHWNQHGLSGDKLYGSWSYNQQNGLVHRRQADKFGAFGDSL